MSSDMDTVDWVLNNVTEGSLEKEVSNYSESNQLPWKITLKSITRKYDVGYLSATIECLLDPIPFPVDTLLTVTIVDSVTGMYNVNNGGLNAIDGRAGTTAVKIERSGGIKLEAVKPKLREGDLGVDVAASGQTEKLESISVILVYNDKSHEDLRWEHYQLCSSTPTNAQFGSKFGQNTSPFGQTAGRHPWGMAPSSVFPSKFLF
ncbi:nuclear pore complex protein NUP98A [Trifolium repens]|nr:nuclear pore complex protein NUP98A [Trifolium repens]